MTGLSSHGVRVSLGGFSSCWVDQGGKCILLQYHLLGGCAGLFIRPLTMGVPRMKKGTPPGMLRVLEQKGFGVQKAFNKQMPSKGFKAGLQFLAAGRRLGSQALPFGRRTRCKAGGGFSSKSGAPTAGATARQRTRPEEEACHTFPQKWTQVLPSWSKNIPAPKDVSEQSGENKNTQKQQQQQHGPTGNHVAVGQNQWDPILGLNRMCTGANRFGF